MTGFDLPATPTYHTRPMPQGWSKPRDLAKLAELRAQFDFEIPLGDLPGIPEEFAQAEGPVRVAVRFGSERGVAIAQVGVTAVLLPLCQRCLAVMRLAIASESRVAIVASEADATALPEELESFLAPEGEGRIAALAAEELLLSLPIVARHAGGERCEPAAASIAQQALQAPAAAGETQRPFADLRALLGRDKSQ